MFVENKKQTLLKVCRDVCYKHDIVVLENDLVLEQTSNTFATHAMFVC